MHPAPTLSSAPPLRQFRVGAFRIPTDAPESDGTLAWDSTTLVVFEIVDADGVKGLGYTYADAAAATLIAGHAPDLLRDRSSAENPALTAELFARLRNLGGQGLTAMAVSAVDVALWDLRAHQLGVPLVHLLGLVRGELPVYGSGGFTAYSDGQLAAQFEAWAARGITRFKMKVGRTPERDPRRVAFARSIIGPAAELFVDANSAYGRRQALHFARIFAAESGVTWLEQPLPPEDMTGLRFLRERGPETLEITDGERPRPRVQMGRRGTVRHLIPDPPTRESSEPPS